MKKNGPRRLVWKEGRLDGMIDTFSFLLNLRGRIFSNTRPSTHNPVYMQVEHGVFFHRTAQFTQPRIFFKYWKYQSFVLINATLHSYIRYTITYNSFQTKYVLLKNNSRYTQPPS